MLACVAPTAPAFTSRFSPCDSSRVARAPARRADSDLEAAAAPVDRSRRMRSVCVSAVAAAIIAAPVLALRPALAVSVKTAADLSASVPAAACRVQAASTLATAFRFKKDPTKGENADFVDKWPKAIALESLVALVVYGLYEGGVLGGGEGDE